MTETIRFSLLGASDVKFGTGTFEVTLADGRVVVLEAINASHVPGLTVNETVDATMSDVYRGRRGLAQLIDFDQDDATTTGLTWGYTSGMAGDGTGAIAKGTLTLTANSTNYVEFDPETGVVSTNTSAFSPTDKVPLRKLVTNASAITTNTDVRPIWRQNVNLLHGQCYLSWISTASVKLLPLNGNRLIINGTTQTIPSAGVALSSSGLTVSTTYYLYAYMNASTMTLEASATAHATSATDGVEIKSGDQTRTYVGSIDVDAAGNFRGIMRQWFRQTALDEPALVELTNSAAGSTAIGDVLAVSSKTAILGDTVTSRQRYVVAREVIANAALGTFAARGPVLAKSTGAIAAMQYVRKSATARCIEDSTVAVGAATALPAGAIGIALAAASGGFCTILLFDVTGVGPASGFYSQVAGVTTASAAYVDATSHTLTITTTGGKVMLTLTGTTSNGANGNTNSYTFAVDAVDQDATALFIAALDTSTQKDAISLSQLVSGLAAGSHTFKVRHKTNGNTASIDKSQFTAVEVL